MKKTYDPQQLQAIQATGGHYLVLAPPGCGKTDILAERIAYAHSQGVAFSDMLCLTFTNRASRGMSERIQAKVGQEETAQLFVGNVHRFCSNFLFDQAIVPASTSIIDEDDLADILLSFNPQRFLNRRGLPDKALMARIEHTDNYITQRQLGHPQATLHQPENYEHDYAIALQARFDPDQVPPAFVMVRYALMYRRYKQEHSLISFADILLLAYEALRTDTQGRYRRYRWIQVDEVQDLNALQQAIIDQLLDTSAPGFTAMYLGDEQQAIFSFLGAKLSQLDLLKQRCAGHVMTLDHNYRSPQYLLQVFNTYAEAELGVDPALLPQPTRQTPFDKLDLILTGNPTSADEDERVGRMIAHYLQYGHERVAVLVPTNAAADRISEKLAEQHIAHFKISGTDLFKSPGYKTWAACLALQAGAFNALAWARLLRGIGALRTGAQARSFVARLKRLLMTPADVLHGQSYLARFHAAYERREFVFFDTETTGLNVLQDDIVQIAAFKVRQGRRVPGSDLCLFLHTDRPIPTHLGDLPNPLLEAYATHPHLDRAEGLQRFLDYVGQCPLLGHNVGYDYRILQHNVARALHRQVRFEVFDSLHLIRCVEPDLSKYKLGFLLQELHLEGQNSHLADEDIAATKAVVDYAVARWLPMARQQADFLAHPKVQAVGRQMQALVPLFEHLEQCLSQPADHEGNSLSAVLRQTYDYMRKQGWIDHLGAKFDLFLRFVQSEWEQTDNPPETLGEQMGRHINDMTTALSEGDLVQSQELIAERVFVMTVHKGKGLEFDNVIVLEANDGTYPFYTVNLVLDAPWSHTSDELAQARQERREDARKFYVALSRARKRLCISYSLRNSYGRPTGLSPFVASIARYFYTGGAQGAR